jgi:hypothetical protein
VGENLSPYLELYNKVNIMNIPLYYENISFEERIVKKTYLQFIVSVNDKKSEKSRVVFETTMPFLLFAPLLIILGIISIPVFISAFIIEQIVTIFSFLKRDKSEMSYEETKQYFKEGHGYFNNLSDEDKKKLMQKIENTPLGL